MLANIEPPTPDMWAAFDAQAPIYAMDTDSGFMSNKVSKKSNSDQDNSKMAIKKQKLKDTTSQVDLWFDLDSFWLSAESPYLPYRTKTLKKLDVNCLLDTNEDFVKHIIKTVYYSYQQSRPRVDGKTDHVVKQIESDLAGQTNESLVDADNKIVLFDVASDWKAHVLNDTDSNQDVQTQDTKTDYSIAPRLKFTARHNGNKLLSTHKRADILFGRRYKKKELIKRSTFITIWNDNLSLTFHFTE